MTWMHVALAGMGCTLAIVGACTHTMEMMGPMAGTIIGDVFGHAMPKRGQKERL